MATTKYRFTFILKNTLSPELLNRLEIEMWDVIQDLECEAAQLFEVEKEKLAPPIERK